MIDLNAIRNQATLDIKGWMPFDKFEEFYPELSEEKQVFSLYDADIKGWMPISEERNMYPEIFGEQPEKEKIWVWEFIQEAAQGLKFETTPESSWLEKLWKAVINLPWDTLEFWWEIVDLVFNPVETVKSFSAIWAWLLDKITKPILNKIPWTNLQPTEEAELVDILWEQLKENFWTADKALSTMANNPFDTLLVVTGWLSSLSKIAKWRWLTWLAGKLETAAKVTDPINIQTAPLKAIWKWAKAVWIKATWLAEETVWTIAKLPEEFAAAEKLWAETVRTNLATRVESKIRSRLDDLKATWKEFEWIRWKAWVASEKALFEAVDAWLAKVWIKKIWDDLDFAWTSLDKVWQKAFTDAIAEINDVAKGKALLSSDDLLNIRRRVDSIIPFDAPWTAKDAVKTVRSQIDLLAKESIPWLAELDAKFAGEITELKWIRKDFFNRDGSLRDNAISKVANLTNKWNEARLSRVKELFKDWWTDIEQWVKILKALEDAWATNKVWTYLQSLAIWWAAFSASWNPLAMLLWLLAVPWVWTTLAKTVWSTKNAFQAFKKVVTPEFIKKNASIIEWKAVAWKALSEITQDLEEEAAQSSTFEEFLENSKDEMKEIFDKTKEEKN